MKTNRTELVFLLDRSSSMNGLEADTIGGYNAMLEKQKAEPGTAFVTTILFDDQQEIIHDRIDIRGISPITEREYYVRGCTALLDAMGCAIKKISSVQKYTAPELHTDKVLFVITTDGLENASREYSYKQIRAMVEERKERFGWEFLFLGANMDAIATAGKIGIHADRAVNYHADTEGTRLNYQAISKAISHAREGAPLATNWKAEIEEDFRTRKTRGR